MGKNRWDNTEMKKKKTWLFDVALISVTVGVALLLALYFKPNTKQGNYVVVEVGGKTVAIYPLDKDGTYQLNNGSNILVVQNGYAMISEANCPDCLCVKQGKINKIGQSIICLPNKLAVIIDSDSSKEVDLVL